MEKLLKERTQIGNTMISTSQGGSTRNDAT